MFVKIYNSSAAHKLCFELHSNKIQVWKKKKLVTIKYVYNELSNEK